MKINKIDLLRESLLEKNATFLFGAGASAPYFSSLGNFENILSDGRVTTEGHNLIKTLFYHQSIKDNIYLSNYINNICYCHSKSNLMESKIHDYSRFLHNILEYLKVRNSRISPKRVNVITANYDLFIESAVDRILEDNPRIFFNDGTNGYGKRILNSDNFNKTLLYSGIFDNYSSEIPCINLIKCHGSVNWTERESKNKTSKIQVLIENRNLKLLYENTEAIKEEFQSILVNKNLQDIKSFDEFILKLNGGIDEQLIEKINYIGDLLQVSLSRLMRLFKKLQIVLPTKQKFEKTLIQEHYFSMLRLLSYELEKEESLLIVFGFSFYDEHIRDVVQRSLNNPSLLIIIFCYTDEDKELIMEQFNFSNSHTPSNVVFIRPNDFFKKTLALGQFENEKEIFESDKYITNDEKESISIYSSLITLIEDDHGNKIPVIDLESLNRILEENIENQYTPKNIHRISDMNG